MNKLAGKNVTLMVLIAISILCASFATCYAREGKHWRLMDVHQSSEIGIEQKGHGHSKHNGGHGKHHGKHKKPPPPGKVLPPPLPPPEPVPEPTPAPEPAPVPPSPSPSPPKHVPVPPPSPSHKHSTTFNVLDFGAKGDGESDDTKAFLSAWSATCKVKASTLIVPSDSVFLVKPVSFLGPCEPGITFQLDGTIIAPTSSNAWGKGLFSWIEFKKLSKITIEGTGTINGRGSIWYNGLIASDGEEEFEAPPTETSTNSPNNMDSANLSKMPKQKPTALRFYGSNDVTVTGITIQNSPQTHLKFDSCINVQVFDFSTSSPGDSPNTDGIHLQNSQNVLIRDSNLACGDDCVSIQTGCSNIDIHDVNCGPGHGFSIGGLGKDNTKACVSDVTVHDCTISNTMTGVRIKTWQGGSGSAQNIMFSNIQMSAVKTPIVIDQFYCDKSKCKNQTSAVAVSRITYENIKGTYTVQPVRFACSDSTPCREIALDHIQLKPVQDGHHMYGPFCYQAYGNVKTATTPPIDCLEKGNVSLGSSKTDSCQA